MSEIKAGGNDRRQTLLPNGPLVMVGGGSDVGEGSEEVDIEDTTDLHVMQQSWLSY